MARVYRAEDTHSGQTVAVKALRAQGAAGLQELLRLSASDLLTRWIAESLGRHPLGIPEPELLDLLRPLLRHDDLYCRVHAARAFWKLGGPEERAVAVRREILLDPWSWRMSRDARAFQMFSGMIFFGISPLPDVVHHTAMRTLLEMGASARSALPEIRVGGRGEPPGPAGCILRLSPTIEAPHTLPRHGAAVFRLAVRGSFDPGPGAIGVVKAQFFDRREEDILCAATSEVRHHGRRKKVIPIDKEWIGDHLNGADPAHSRTVNISCQDAASSDLPDNSLDAVFTDPPYFGNVQYAELMDFCYVWLKRLVGQTSQVFNAVSTRNMDELTGNVDMGRDLDHFTEGLSAVFQRMSKALKPGAPLAFTYHHNNIEAYYPVAVAILDAGLACSASLPCPAEMGASIHINGTGSSIIDTVFVCRSTGVMQRKWLANSPEEVAKIVEEDLAYLRAGNVKPTSGDIRCITCGHLIRLAIWLLRSGWDKNKPTASRLADVQNWLQRFGAQGEVEKFIETNGTATTKDIPLFAAHESVAEYGAQNANVSF